MNPLRLSGDEVMIVQAVVAALAMALLGLAFARSRGGLRWPRGSLPLLVVLSIVAAPTYFYLSRSPNWLHQWDLFHTVMGAKYHAELGYYGLYECALERDAAGRRHFRKVRKVRDLETLDYTTRERVLERAHCAGRFDEARGEAFDRDLTYFQGEIRHSKWKRLFKDKGYNGSPFYTAMVGTLLGSVAIDHGTLTALALIDLLLLALAFGAVAWAFGARVGLLSLVFFCVCFPNRFVHMGGSILRFDYVAYLMAGFALLRAGRPALAGALLALSGAIRMFPLVFVACWGLATGLASLRARRIDPADVRFLGSFTAVLTACLGASVAFGGLDIWRQFLANMGTHSARVAGYRVGFRYLFMLAAPDGDWGRLSAHPGVFEDTRLVYYAAALGFAGALLWLARRLPPHDFAILGGLVAFFVATAATRYYYSVLVLLFLLTFERGKVRQKLGCWLGAFAVSLGGYLGHTVSTHPPFLYNAVTSGLLALFFVALLSRLILGPRVEAADP